MPVERINTLVGRQAEKHALSLLLAICTIIQAADLHLFTAVLKALEEHFSVSPTDLGFLLLLQGLGQCLAAPVWGYAADRYDRLQLLYSLLLCLSVLTMLTAIAPSFASLGLARALTGILGAGLGPISQTMSAGAVRAEDRGKIFGLFVVCLQIGAIAGTVYGATLSHLVVFGFEGWRFAFLSMALVTLVVGTVLATLREELSNVLRHALLVSPISSDFFSDAKTVFSKKSFQVLLLQGAFASAGYAAMSFMIMVYQYSGFTDFQASTLVSFNAVGHAIGALASGFLADKCAKWMPGHGRIYYGQAGNVFTVTMLTGFAVAGMQDFLNSEHYSLIATFSLLLGFFQLWAYVGAVKPILSEIVPFRLVGQTLSYAAAIDGAFASFMGAPVVGFIAEFAFGYHRTDQLIKEMVPELREGNRDSLCRALIGMVTVAQLLAFFLFSLLHKTYPEDKQSSLQDDEVSSPLRHESKRLATSWTCDLDYT